MHNYIYRRFRVTTRRLCLFAKVPRYNLKAMRLVAKVTWYNTNAFFLGFFCERYVLQRQNIVLKRKSYTFIHDRKRCFQLPKLVQWAFVIT